MVQQTNSVQESFEALLNESLASEDLIGKVIQGTIRAIEKGNVIIDVGLKSEGRVPLTEFSPSGQTPDIKVGDKVDVYLVSMEGVNGEVVLSREKAVREEAWAKLEEMHEKNERVNGVMFGKVKGGFTVDLAGVVAFLPGSQIDVRPIRDIDTLMGVEQPFLILKMDKARNNIVVSRRAILEEDMFEARSGLMEDMKEGKIVKGVVKNITNYGAFIDLGGIDGLLHVTDLSWQRVNHPSDMLELGQEIEAKVIKFDSEKQRISLGIKQMSDDPWANVESKFKVGDKCSGKVTNIADYGAFVDLGDGVEGLVHVSEMSWTRKNLHPSKVVSVDQTIEVQILEVDTEKRRIALGLKQCTENPWEALAEKLKVGDEVEGKIRNITEFGLFIQLSDDIDGMVHMSDLSWDKDADEAIKEYTKGESIKVKVLEVDPERERIALGVKQLTKDNFAGGDSESGGLKKGDVVTSEVKEVHDDHLVVDVDGVSAIIKQIDLSKDRGERRTDRFAVGEKVDAIVSNIDRKNRTVNLSIKALQIQEEKKAMDKYGSVDSGASLGDILGAALKEKEGASSSDNKNEKK